MPRTYTPAQGARVLQKVALGFDAAVLKGIGALMREAQKRAITKYMTGGRTVVRKWGSGSVRVAAPSSPPNPPPGPLRKRTGRLARSVDIIPPVKKGNAYETGLRSSAPHAGIHERGGIIRGGPTLTFPTHDGAVSTDLVQIPARPYMEPAIRDVEPIADLFVQAAVAGLVERAAGQVRATGFSIIGGKKVT